MSELERAMRELEALKQSAAELATQRDSVGTDLVRAGGAEATRAHLQALQREAEPRAVLVQAEVEHVRALAEAERERVRAIERQARRSSPCRS
jgi:hypothetical protein